jgi:Tol biopolymer transport system component
MVTGRRAFASSSHASLVAAILTTEPAPMATLEPLTLPGLERVVRKCLAKDPELRWQTARDLLDDLRWIARGGSAGLEVPAPSKERPRVRRGVAALVVLACLATVVLATAVWPPAPDTPSTFQFVVAPPDGSAFNAAPAFMAVSPDGRHLTFSAANRNAGQALWLRSLDSLDVRQLTSEEGAQPFWSSDSQFIAFYAGGAYKRIDIRTGRVQRLVDVSGQSGTWSRDGVIVMKLADRPVLSRFSIVGGPATPATTLDATRGETAHTWPQFLPDGRRFLYMARSAQAEFDRTICVGSLDSDARTILFKADSHAVYAPPGYLLFMRGNTLVAQPFDASSLRFTGEAVPIVDGVDIGPGGRAAFSVSNTRVLAYRAVGQTRLMWLNREGRIIDVVGPPGTYANPALSPDGRRVAVARFDSEKGASDIWLIELARGSLSRFTSGAGAKDMPLWTPDGERVVFRATQQAGSRARDMSGAGFFDKSSSGDGPEQRVLINVGPFANPLGWSRQGQALVYAHQRDKTLSDLGELPRPGRQPVALLQSEFQEIQAQPSSDGRWMAYVSNESGRYEVYVRSLHGEGKWPVSAAGGLEPKWRRDGKELFYLAADRSLMSVTVRDTGSTLELSTPIRLFETRMSTIPNTSFTRNQYDVTADGQRFLVNQPPTEAAPAPISVIVNWPAALRR